MGMYTELFLDCDIDSNLLTVDEKIIIDYLFCPDFDWYNTNPEDLNLPSHNFFNCYRWSSIGRGGSAYFTDDIPQLLIKNDNIWSIVSRSDFKNYDDEIELFLDWFTPFIIKNTEQPTFVGHEHYEENEEPTLIFV